MQQVRWGAAAMLALVPLAAAAEPTPVRLSYARDRGAACPSEDDLRAGVRRRLGTDPFRAEATRALGVRIAGAPPRLTATIELDADGRKSRRTLRSTGADCGDLAAAVELAMSLAIDPLWEPWEEPHIEILPEPREVAPPPRPLPASLGGAIAVEDEPGPRRPRGRGPWHIGVGSFLTVGTAPDLVIGVRLELGVRVGKYSLTVEPWMTLPSATSAPGGHVTLSTAAGSLVGCRALAAISLCAHLAGGVLQAVGEGVGFVQRDRARTPFGAVGARALYVLGVYPGIDIRATADLLAPVLRTRLYADSSTGKIQAWTSPWLLPSLGVAFVGRFP